jgi:hypothetical protein
MADHLVVHDAHTFIMNSRATAHATINFLREGRFTPISPEGE